jgi:DNA-binding transcriptional regulator YiaG
MPNIQSMLKDEITRIARKEVRRGTADVKKSSSTHRAQIAALRRQVEELTRALKQAVRATSPRTAPAAEETADTGVQRRFRVAGFASLRKRLALSAEQMGMLIGVSGQSVYKWEKGEAKPRARQLEAIAAVRELGPREARTKLEELQGGQAGGQAQKASTAAAGKVRRPVAKQPSRRKASQARDTAPQRRRA